MATFVAWLVTQFVTLLLRLFFRETGSFNRHKIPTDAAVIFVCAPHANQVRLATNQNVARRPCRCPLPF